MASACINNIGLSPENFLDCPAKFPSYGWLSPRMSFGRDEDASKARPSSPPKKTVGDAEVEADPEVFRNEIAGDFEFRLEDPVRMLPADELFSDGKLVPLHLSMFRPAASSSDIRSSDTPKVHPRCETSRMDPYLFSPKAPRCSSRWKEILGLRKLYQNSNAKENSQKTSSVLPNQSNGTSTNSAKSLKHFLHRSSKSSLSSTIDSSLSLPLLKDTDNELISISSRLSLSSSSSGHDHDDLPRLSLDIDKPIHTSITQKHHNVNQNPPRIRLVKHRTASDTKLIKRPMRQPVDNNAAAGTGPVVSVDSPRMNSSGKIVFQSLERSSSSPGSFNGGPRKIHRGGMERSYSANVRVTPVLNVPVCSIRGSSKSGSVFGFPLFSAPQHKRDGGNGNNGGPGGGIGSRSSHHHQQVAARTKRIDLH